MPRMRRSAALAALTLAFCSLLRSTASADLIRSEPPLAYPDLAAGIVGAQRYTYDPSTRTGQFHVTNTPFLFSLGPRAKDELNVEPNDDGTRSQVLNLTLDRDGHLVDNPNNSYALYGTVVIQGQTYHGLLVKGTPTAFGARGQAEVEGSARTAVYDLDMKITGGALAQALGPDAYLRIVPRSSTFEGRFNEDFSSAQVASNTQALHATTPTPVPEPTTLVLLLACGAGLLCRNRRRLSVRELTAKQDQSA